LWCQDSPPLEGTEIMEWLVWTVAVVAVLYLALRLSLYLLFRKPKAK
jgi:hypothetical protein